MANADLYDEDFYLWTQAQAEALRAEGRRRKGSNAVEWELVAEEVEDLGKSDLHRAEGLIRQILLHLFKLEWTNRREPKGHWKSEISTFRASLKRKLTASIAAKVQAELENLHVEAEEAARFAFESEEPSAATPSRRWTLAQIIGEENDPLS